MLLTMMIINCNSSEEEIILIYNKIQWPDSEFAVAAAAAFWWRVYAAPHIPDHKCPKFSRSASHSKYDRCNQCLLHVLFPIPIDMFGLQYDAASAQQSYYSTITVTRRV
jgi:hypothetical protein